MKMKMSFRERSREVVKSGILVMAILVLLCVTLLVKIYYRGVYLSRIEDESKVLDTQVKSLEKISTKVMIVKRFVERKKNSLDIV